VGVVEEFVWCSGDPVVVADGVRSGSVLAEPDGDGLPEWAVRRVGVGVDGFLEGVWPVVSDVVEGVCGERVVVWRGSVREWRVGEWAEPHSDVFDAVSYTHLRAHET